MDYKSSGEFFLAAAGIVSMELFATVTVQGEAEHMNSHVVSCWFYGGSRPRVYISRSGKIRHRLTINPRFSAQSDVGSYHIVVFALFIRLLRRFVVQAQRSSEL